MQVQIPSDTNITVLQLHTYLVLLYYGTGTLLY